MLACVRGCQTCLNVFVLCHCAPPSWRMRVSNQVLGGPFRKGAGTYKKSEVVRTSIPEALHVFARALL